VLDQPKPNQVQTHLPNFSEAVSFGSVNWNSVPEAPGVYAIFDQDELLYVGMAGRDGKGTLRRRLKDHASGQVVNMFTQYLFFARAQFLAQDRVKHPSHAKELCQRYIKDRCLLSWRVCETASEARDLEAQLKRSHNPALNGVAQNPAS
jgi:excinuclease UvrABC nuclease subunit